MEYLVTLTARPKADSEAGVASAEEATRYRIVEAESAEQAVEQVTRPEDYWHSEAAI